MEELSVVGSETGRTEWWGSDMFDVGRGRMEVLISEVGCSFDSYMEQAFAHKLLKYQPFVSHLNSLGYQGKLVMLESLPCIEADSRWPSVCRPA